MTCEPAPVTMYILTSLGILSIVFVVCLYLYRKHQGIEGPF